MSVSKNLTGISFNRITVIKKSHKGPNGWLWECDCICGNKMYMLQYDILKKKTMSCGCFQKEVVKEILIKRNTSHGLSKTREYKIWQGIKKRCFNNRFKFYPHYGGRGITICKSWLNFESFLADMGPCPEGHSIDRINNDGNYEPKNCRWAKDEIQANNKRSNRILDCFGEKLTMSMAAEKYRINYKMLHRRLKLGWPIEKALTDKKHKNQFS